MITLTAKVQVLPDIKQAELLKATMSMYRDACNYKSRARNPTVLTVG